MPNRTAGGWPRPASAHPGHRRQQRDAPGSEQGGVSAALDDLRQRGHPLIQHIRIARPFRNLGVAASWNLILSTVPEAPLALLANNDTQFAPGVLERALSCIDPARPQFLALLEPPNAFAAFLLTCLYWDHLGLFDANFHPAYCEDLDYRDHLQADPAVQQLDGSFAQAAMAACNPNRSATIGSDPELARYNRSSYALNSLWYLSERRLRPAAPRPARQLAPPLAGPMAGRCR